MEQTQYLTEADAADLLHVGRRTLQRWRVTGEGPVFRRAGRRILYNLSDIEDFLEASKAQSTSENRGGAA